MAWALRGPVADVGAAAGLRLAPVLATLLRMPGSCSGREIPLRRRARTR